MAADLVAEYRRGSFICSVIFREPPPGPEAWDLPASSRLQLLTEFFETDEPVRVPGFSDAADGLRDTTLKFGTNLTMVRGTAFAIGSVTNQPARARHTTIPVYKSWETLWDTQDPAIRRKFLIEEVPYRKIKDRLKELATINNSSRMLASAVPLHSQPRTERVLPAFRPITRSTGGVLLAKADRLSAPGYVLDYVTLLSGQCDFTFRGDTTYLISGQWA